MVKAEEAIDELEKCGAIADKQWYGESMEFNPVEEAIGVGKAKFAFEYFRFEIEESKAGESSKVRDALQCSTDRPVF